jgi:hypothetical protein
LPEWWQEAITKKYLNEDSELTTEDTEKYENNLNDTWTRL